jgi:hypothetical protein
MYKNPRKSMYKNPRKSMYKNPRKVCINLILFTININFFQ